MLKIIEKSRIWFSVSLLIIIIGMISLAVNGLNFGIDFKGGTVVVIEMGNSPFQVQDVEAVVRKYASDAIANTVDVTKVEIKSNNFDNVRVGEAFNELKEKYTLEQNALISQDEIGPSIGKELTRKALISMALATLAILAYVAIRFEFRFGVAAIIALIHDVLITLSVYAIFNIPVNSPFIAAVLTIVGYSINDTIVVFDRIRENVKNMRKVEVAEIANHSINQTLSRSINTSLTTLVTIAAVYFLVPPVRDFAFPIIIGIIAGAYSSIFIASPLWVILTNRSRATA